MRLGGRRLHLGSLGSLGCVLVVVWFRRMHWGAVHPRSLGSLGCAWGVVRFMRSSGSSGVTALIGFLAAGRRVHPGS